MRTAYQALVVFVGLACSVFVAAGLADIQPVAPAAESADVLAESPETAVEDIGPEMPAAAAVERQAEEPRPQPHVSQAAARPKPPVIRRVYRVTAYNDRGTTASGTLSGVGQCAAPEDIPFGSKIYIPALRRTLVVTDRTHPRFRHNTVDIFMPREQQCWDFGRRYLKCEVTLPTSSDARRAGGRT